LREPNAKVKMRCKKCKKDFLCPVCDETEIAKLEELKIVPGCATATFTNASRDFIHVMPRIVPFSPFKEAVVQFLESKHPNKYTTAQILAETQQVISRSSMCKHLQDLLNDSLVQRERQGRLQDHSTPFYYSYLPPQQRTQAKVSQTTEHPSGYRSTRLDSQRLHRLAVSIHKETM
jgi:hypothetical protein